MAREWSWKKISLLTCQILGLFAYILAGNDKYPFLNRENLTITIEIHISHKQQPFSQFFSAFLKSRLNSEHVEKKMTVIDFVFPKLRTPKRWLDKYLKRPPSEDSSTNKMVKGPERCRNLHHGSSIRFIYQCEGIWVVKSLTYLHEKSWDCLLTHWLPMTSILFLIETI